MATVSNLSFADVNVETTADPKIGADIFTFNAGVITLNISTLTGDTYTALTDLSMAEVFYKLHKYTAQAQETVNTATATTVEEELKSFPGTSFGIPTAEGEVEVIQSQAIILTLDDSKPVGVN